MTLIDRLSKLDGPDDDADAEIAMQVCGFTRENLMEAHPEEKPLWEYFDQERNRIGRHGPMIPRYTAYIDAAIALARRQWPDMMYRVGNDSEGIDPSLYLGEIFIPGEDKDRYFTAVASTDAIALCIAILRAKEASK